MKLRGRTAIITGAGRGIGRASAMAMAAEGADVALISRTASEVADTAAAVGGRALHFAGDVSRPADVKSFVSMVLERFGRIDVLMNNAAVRGPLLHLHKVDPEDWESTVAINLGGAYLFSREVVPHMIAGGGGKIINVTSGLGEMVLPPLGVYSVTKAALNHLTRIMAEELKVFNIQVNGLDPGAVDTRMQDEIRDAGPDVLGAEVYGEFKALKDSGYIEPPEHPARLAVFLASPASDGVTGEIGTRAEFARFGFRDDPS